jgi:DNA topoisomerase-2
MDLVIDEDADIPEMTPWYKGFTGTIKKTDTNKWITQGKYTVKGNVITVTELPIGTWTDDYKTFLDKLETEGTIFGYTNESTETTINLTIKCPLENVVEWTQNCEVLKKLKLISHLSANNMYVFNEKNEIVKMESPEEIIFHFWRIRNEYYIKRQNYICGKLKNELIVLNSKIKFVTDIMEDKIIVFKQTLKYIVSQLEKSEYPKISDSYEYLTNMKIHSFSSDTIEKLTNSRDKINEEYKTIKNYSLRNFWEKDI